tara:strand:+ start:12783 stop:13697 length:915 start_codon:yes stop_codon:yes gene_type:complete
LNKSIKTFTANQIVRILKKWVMFKRRRLSKSILSSRLAKFNEINSDIKKSLGLIKEITKIDFSKESLVFNESKLIDIQKDIDKKLTKCFTNNYPYQSGALEDEMKFLCHLILAKKPLNILEVGIANGYSSEMIQKSISLILKEKNNAKHNIIRIDMPRFETTKRNLYTKLVAYSYKNSNLLNEQTRSVFDIKEGGVIPKNKYAGWLISDIFDDSINIRTFYGNVFNLEERFSNTKFDFILLDAMKDAKSRYQLLKMLSKHLSNEALIIFDGAWINSAVEDFAVDYNLDLFEVGRCSILRNRIKV